MKTNLVHDCGLCGLAIGGDRDGLEAVGATVVLSRIERYNLKRGRRVEGKGSTRATVSIPLVSV